MSDNFQKTTQFYKKTIDVVKNFINFIPSLKKYEGKTIVIKCGNSNVANKNCMDTLAQDVAIMTRFGIKVIVVHGGGPEINQMLSKLAIRDRFIDGQRVVDQENFDIIEMVIKGHINSKIVSNINQYGVSAIGVSGRDDNSIVVEKVKKVEYDIGSNIEKIVDLGFIGSPIYCNEKLVKTLLDKNFIPVIAPFGVSLAKTVYIINADVLASFIAKKFNAYGLILLSDVDGFSNIQDQENTVISKINIKNLDLMIAQNKIEKQLIQKAQSSIVAASSGVEYVKVINGLIPHATLFDLINNEEPIGTQIVA